VGCDHVSCTNVKKIHSRILLAAFDNVFFFINSLNHMCFSCLSLSHTNFHPHLYHSSDYHLRNKKHVPYRNTSGSLGEQEMLWEDEPLFFFEVSQTFFFDYQKVNSLCLRHHYINSSCKFCVSIELWKHDF